METAAESVRQRLEQLDAARRSTEERDAHDIIREAREKAAAAAPRTQHGDANDGAQTVLPFKVEDEATSIIPYEIIATITQFENIYETRLFGWCLAKAQAVLKLYNHDLRDINLQHALDVTRVTLPARFLLNPGDKNYGNIPKAFTLATKQIHYTKAGHEYWLSIIAFPEIRTTEGGKKEVTFLLHREVWHALLDFSHGHRIFSMPTFIELTSKYSCIMYLLCSQQDSTPRSYGMARLRAILGCGHLKGYDRGNNFVQKVLAPARAELLQKAPFYYDYSLTKTGSAGRISEVIIIPRPNTQYRQPSDATRAKCSEMRLRLDAEVRDYCVRTFCIKLQPLEKLEHIILALGDKDAQLSRLAQIKEQISIRRVKNPAGYFTRSIKNTQTQT